MGILSDIQDGVFLKLKTANPGTIVWPNIPYTGAVPYLRVHILPAETQPLGIANGDIYKGIIQIDCVTADGIGPAAAATLADTVIGTFVRNTTTTKNTTTIRFLRTGSAGPGQQESERYFIPVSIPYEVIS